MSARTIVISDIHIGDDTRACWYQKAVHEPTFMALLDWVIGQASDIRELVILGDLFDFWTYGPDVRPPTMAQIVAANPNTLGPGGKISQLLDALDGRVVYLPGNHDIDVTQQDLDLVGDSRHTIRKVPDLYLSDGVLYMHGHHSTIFNAPPPDIGPATPTIPVGHFVTRMLSHLLLRDLPAGQTAADVIDNGAPQLSGVAFLRALGTGANRVRKQSVAAALLEFMSDYSRFPLDGHVRLARPLTPDLGDTVTLNQVVPVYRNLWSQWVDQHGGGSVGEHNARMSARADKDGTHLGWFAEQLRRRHGARAVVTGHTHIPRSGLVAFDKGPELGGYLNTGLLCPTTTQLRSGSQRFSFGIVAGVGGPTLAAASLAAGTLRIDGLAAPTEPVVVEGYDYSCYVQVRNDTAAALTLTQATAEFGYWATPPPTVIAPGATAEFWLQDKPMIDAGIAVGYGAEGGVVYANQYREARLRFGCPWAVTSRNYCTGGDDRLARTGTGPWRREIDVDGYPVMANYIVGG